MEVAHHTNLNRTVLVQTTNPPQWPATARDRATPEAGATSRPTPRSAILGNTGRVHGGRGSASARSTRLLDRPPSKGLGRLRRAMLTGRQEGGPASCLGLPSKLTTNVERRSQPIPLSLFCQRLQLR